jgi:hypothetical protein
VTDEAEARAARELLMSTLPWWWLPGRRHRFMMHVDRFAIAYAHWRETAREEARQPPPNPPIEHWSHL